MTETLQAIGYLFLGGAIANVFIHRWITGRWRPWK